MSFKVVIMFLKGMWEVDPQDNRDGTWTAFECRRERDVCVGQAAV